MSVNKHKTSFSDNDNSGATYRAFSVFIPPKLFICYVLFFIIPVAVHLFAWPKEIALSAVYQDLLVFVALILVMLLLQMIRYLFLLTSKVMSIVAGTYYTYIYMQILVKIAYGSPIEWKFISDAGLSDSWNTLIAMYGLSVTMLVTVGILVCLILSTKLISSCGYRIPRIRPHSLHGFLVASGILGLIYFSFTNQIVSYRTSAFVLGSEAHASANEEFHNDFGAIKPIQTSNSEFFTKSKENIFILQLESINSLAINGYGTDEIGTRAYEKYMPKLTRIAEQHGVFIPMFWGNSMQTHRAMANILCGISGNVQSALAERPEDISSRCLPQILLEAGYRTFFYSSFPKPNYENKDVFTKTIGIEERHFSDYIEEEVPQSKFGYDDCIFYKRTFDHLKEKTQDNTDSIFAYMSVSSHHQNFHPREEYKSQWFFPEENSDIERYLNSNAEQDYCIAKFFEEYKPFQKNSHLFILSDHSFPFVYGPMNNAVGAKVDNFLIPFAYIPPEDRKDEFAIGTVLAKIQFSETDIIPTILDLLNGKTYQNSFAFALRKVEKSWHKSWGEGLKQSYEDCHILAQPYDGGWIAIVKGDLKYNYSIKDGKLYRINLQEDISEESPILISENMPYETFKNKYYCKRYQ